MASFDDFIHISTGPPAGPSPAEYSHGVPADYYDNAKGRRWSTEAMVVGSIRTNHPKHHLTITPGYFYIDFLAFGNASDDVTYSPHGDPADIMAVRKFIPPARRYNDEIGGTFVQLVQFGCYDYVFKGQQFLIYIASGSEGGLSTATFSYILVEDLTNEGKAVAQKKADDLIAAAAKWTQELHEEVMVFDQGFWQKNKELWQNIQKSNWEDVILENGKEEAIIEDVVGFFNAQKKYEEFGVPWKVCSLQFQHGWPVLILF
jgi:transitional endoplasmic reticulum ATPase